MNTAENIFFVIGWLTSVAVVGSVLGYGARVTVKAIQNRKPRGVCEVCKGKGWLYDGHTPDVPCPRCDGR